MADLEHLKSRVEALAGRKWDLPGIEARHRRLLLEGISPRPLDAAALAARRGEILDRIQTRAEEYEYLSHS